MVEDRSQIPALLSEQKALRTQLDGLLWGAVELRGNDDAAKVYLHRRIDGASRTVYAGRHNHELLDTIARDNLTARQLKQRLRQIAAELKRLGYKSSGLSDKVKTNIDLAKRQLVDSIYDQAKLEGVAVTYLDTETIVEGGRVNGISADDIQKVNNLKHAWQFILDEGTVTSPSNYGLLCQINKLVIEGFYYNAGNLRTVPVKISGTTWQPDIPLGSVVREHLDGIATIDDAYERAVNALLYVMRSQLFIDGNKRTAVILANHILISSGAGLLAIPDNLVDNFRNLLINYYEADDWQEISRFLLSKCIIKI